MALNPLNQMPALSQSPGEGQTKPLSTERQTSIIPAASQQAYPPDACPVAHASRPADPANACPAMYHDRPQAATPTGDRCPVQHQGSSSSSKANASQEYTAAPGGNDEAQSRWVYPSAQQFWNALQRKGYETDPDDVPLMLTIHNDMNDRSWKEVLRWERLNGTLCEPKLKRFCGRPSDLTPKAWLYYQLGWAPKPFDRHDWIVDRCGKEVRYVIDYYAAHQDAVIHADVRPAIDSVASFVQRVKMAWLDWSSD